jgi:predicted DNA-binding transcriptional regulator YafY
MRADRLISLLMLLQSRGRMTAHELAELLEVSERTIYRDVEALSGSGVPLYAEHGPGGGLALLDSYRTNLTGLNEGELRALFMMFSLPGPLDKLGVRQELKSAMLKLSAALPNASRKDEEKVRQRFYLDWSWWFHNQEPVPHLVAIRQAVWEERPLRLHYRNFLSILTSLEVKPYGLVAKAGIWYLVAGVDSAQRVFQISFLADVEVLEGTFTQPADFDLAAFWQRWCAEYEQNQHAFQARLRVSPALVRILPLYFGRRVSDLLAEAGPPDAEGWFTITLSFESLEAARDRILNFGSAAEVLEPLALRCTLLDYAEQIVSFYRKK